MDVLLSEFHTLAYRLVCLLLSEIVPFEII